MQPAVKFLHFGPFTAPVRFDDCDDLISGFKTILLGWDVVETDERGPVAPIIRFYKRNGHFQWQSKRLPPPRGWHKRRGHRKVMDAVADFHYVFLDWYSNEFRAHFCLHCAAVEMAGGLVIFPSIRKAGKSTLVTELARRKHRVYCDDVLVIDPETREGIALGIMSRLRLPLPDTLTDAQLEFVTAHMGLSDRFAAYVNLSEPVFAPLGRAASIRAIVLLDRQTEKTEAAFQDATRAQALSKLIDQNFAEHLSPTMIFNTLLEITEKADLVTLQYSDLGAAADLLEARFGG